MALATHADVALGWRTLTTAQQERATFLIAVAEAWIRDPSRRPDIVDGDPIAKHVVVEVVRTAMGPSAEFTGHTSYSKTVGPWAKSGSLAGPIGSLAFTDAQKELLGIASEPVAVGEFGDPCGYRYPPPGSVLS